MKNKRLIIIMTSAAILLSIPLIAMLFTTEVNWGIFDFVIMGILLFGTGLICELALRNFKSTTSRVVICGVILFSFFLLWAELAVGIFDSPIAGS